MSKYQKFQQQVNGSFLLSCGKQDSQNVISEGDSRRHNYAPLSLKGYDFFQVFVKFYFKLQLYLEHKKLV